MKKKTKGSGITNAYEILDGLEGVPDMDYDGYAPVHESVDWGTVFLLNIIWFKQSLRSGDYNAAFESLEFFESDIGVYLKDDDEYYVKLKAVRVELEKTMRMVHPENRQYAKVEIIRALLMERYRLLMHVMRKLGLMPKTSRAD